MSRAEAEEADRQAARLIARAMRLLDLSEIAEALRDDVGTETVLLLKEVLDRAPLPSIGSVRNGVQKGSLELSEWRWSWQEVDCRSQPTPGGVECHDHKS